MEKNLSALIAATDELRRLLDLQKRIGPDTIEKKQKLVIALTRDALAGHTGKHWPPTTPTGDDLVKFADRVIALVPTLDEVKAGRQ